MLTSFAGARLFGESYGSGTPEVLVLHGWRRDHGDFARLLCEPQPLDAIALDLPGFGGTPAPEEVWGSAAYASALEPVLEEMAPRVVVVGHSFGGRVAVQLAAARPERIGGLVLTGVPLFRQAPQPSPLPFRVVKRLAGMGLVSDQRLERYRQRYGSEDYRVASGVMRDVLVTLVAEEHTDEYAEVLSRIECPVELIWGADDTAAPVSAAERIRDTIPTGAHLVVCEGVGHMTPLSVPGELRAAVERLLP